MTAKTSEKLDLVYKFANDTGLWVGLDDLAEEGRHVWQQDGSELTNDVLEEVFRPTNLMGIGRRKIVASSMPTIKSSSTTSATLLLRLCVRHRPMNQRVKA